MDLLEYTLNKMVLRNIYLDKKLDKKLKNKALKNSINREILVRFCLDKGLEFSFSPIKLPKMTKQNLVLRTNYISSSADDILRTKAFDLKIERNDLVRQYISFGFSLLTKKDIIWLKNNFSKESATKLSYNMLIDGKINKELISYMKENKIKEANDVFFNYVLKLGLVELKKLEKEKKLPISSVKSKIKPTVKITKEKK